MDFCHLLANTRVKLMLQVPNRQKFNIHSSFSHYRIVFMSISNQSNSVTRLLIPSYYFQMISLKKTTFKFKSSNIESNYHSHTLQLDILHYRDLFPIKSHYYFTCNSQGPLHLFISRKWILKLYIAILMFSCLTFFFNAKEIAFILSPWRKILLHQRIKNCNFVP